MKRTVNIALIGMLFFSFAACAGFQQSLVQQMTNADRQLREQSMAVMARAAAAATISLEPGQMLYGSRGDTILVNTPIAGLDSVAITAFARGVDAAFVFFSSPSNPDIPGGFYTVRIFGEPGAAGKAELRDSTGKVVTVPATVEVGSGKGPNVLTMAYDPIRCKGDYHVPGWSVSWILPCKLDAAPL